MSGARRIVITGMGMITPLGTGVATNWERMLRGDSGVRRIHRVDTTTLEVKIAGEIVPLPEVPEDESVQQLGIHSRFALVAAREAWASSGLEDFDGLDRSRAGLYLGSGKGILDIERLVPAIKAARADGDFKFGPFTERAAETIDPYRRLEEPYHRPGTHVARALGLEGPNAVCITACAAGNHALGEAYLMLRRGDTDVMVAGGTHSQVDLMSIAGYSTLGALSTRNDEPGRASRPFDRKRDGFILGEGSGVLVLEELEHARARGATIHAEVIGYGNTDDCYRVTDPHPEGRGAEKAMRLALKSAGLAPDAIDYVNAHGTSTSQNDAQESAAIARIFGPKGEAPPVSSVKSMVGHLIAAAGAIEAITCVRALQEGVIPPTINYEHPDPACDLDYVPNEPREAKVRHTMNNSFGFGGQNIVTIFRRWE